MVTSTSSLISIISGLLTIVSGDGQPAVANSTITLKVKVTNPAQSDSSGNLVAASGAVVTWSAEAGDTFASATTKTGADGIAANTVKLGPGVGPRRVQASIPGASVTFVIPSAEESVIRPAQSLINPQAQSSIVSPQAQLQNIGTRPDELRMMRKPKASRGD